MIKKDNTYNLQELIGKLIKAYRWDGKIDEMRIIDSWKSVVGPMIERHTTSINLKGKTLYVKMDSSALRNELIMARSKVVKSLNKEVGREVLTDIVFR